MKNNETVLPNNSFSELLRQQRKGEFLTEASEALQKLGNSVREHQRPGKLTITVKMQPNGEAMTITDDIEVKCPKPTVKGSIFYLTDEGALTRTDPNQVEMKLSVVSTGAPGVDAMSPAALAQQAQAAK